MERFVAWEEERAGAALPARRERVRQAAMLTMAHEDCHTIPFLWMYAHRAPQEAICRLAGHRRRLHGGTGCACAAARHPDETFKSPTFSLGTIGHQNEQPGSARLPYWNRIHFGNIRSGWSGVTCFRTFSGSLI